MEMAKRLAYLRKEKGLTQLDLAEEIGVSRQTISKWEAGDATPSRENLKRLCELYQIPFEQLFGTDETPSEKAPGKDPAEVRPGQRPGGMTVASWVVFFAAVAAVLLAAALVFWTVGSAERPNVLPMDDMQREVVTPDADDTFDFGW